MYRVAEEGEEVVVVVAMPGIPGMQGVELDVLRSLGIQPRVG